MQKALGLGAIGAVGLGGLHVPRLARAVAGERKHFISLVARGGWDSYLGHQSMITSHLSGMQIDDYSDIREGSSLTRRFREEDISRVDDPKGGPRYMGPLWNDARMGDVFNRMAIWRGLVKEGEHDAYSRYENLAGINQQRRHGSKLSSFVQHRSDR